MPAIHQIDHDAKLIVTTWQGDAVDTDFIEAITKYQKEIQGCPEYINYDEVVDFSYVNKIKLTTQGIKSLGKIASKTDQREVEKKLALIVSSNLAFGLARMYVAYRNFEKNSSKVIRIFKTEDEAYKWLTSKT